MRNTIILAIALSLIGLGAVAADEMCDGAYDSRMDQLRDASEISDDRRFELAAQLHEAHRDCMAGLDDEARKETRDAMFSAVWDKAFDNAGRN